MAPFTIDPEDAAADSALRRLAEQAARAGGAVARDGFRGTLAVRRKHDGSEVTDVDEAAQAAVLACLRDARPHDAVIAEEGSQDSGSAGAGPQREATDAATPAARTPPSNDSLCWIVDPLDGTRNFVSGVPIYACSVAAMLGGYPVVGAIYDPQRDELYSAARKAELLINGRPPSRAGVDAGELVSGTPLHDRTRSSNRAGPSQARGLRPGRGQAGAAGRTMAHHDLEQWRKPLAGIPSSLQGSAYAILQRWGTRVVVRNLGSTALHLAMVAAGQFQAALISDSRLWDIAAGWLMVTVTGGVMTRLDGQPVFPLDVARYAGEPIPSLAARDPQMHARLLPTRHRPP